MALLLCTYGRIIARRILINAALTPFIHPSLSCFANSLSIRMKNIYTNCFQCLQKSHKLYFSPVIDAPYCLWQSVLSHVHHFLYISRAYGFRILVHFQVRAYTIENCRWQRHPSGDEVLTVCMHVPVLADGWVVGCVSFISSLKWRTGMVSFQQVYIWRCYCCRIE